MSEYLELIRRGRADYGFFMTHALDVQEPHLWSKMIEVNNSVRDKPKTAVGAGHGVSKTYGGARIGLSFLYCYVPSTVVTLAPSLHQVKNLMWREIREAHTNARVRLGGKLTTLQLDMQPDTGRIWFATGISTKPDTITQEATRVQGIHNEHVLIILDEAAAISPEIWRAIQYIGAPFKRVLAIGNPTSKFGDFPAALKDPTWNHIQISVKDTPNFKQGKQIIPGVYGREFEREVRLKYGRDSDQYRVRVLGGISEKGSEGAYYGKKINKLEKAGRISDTLDHNPNYPVYPILDPGYTTAVGVLQSIETNVNFIRAYEDSGLSIEEYAVLFGEWEKQYGYKIANIFVPCDMDSKATAVVTGQTALDTLRQFNYNVTPLPRESTVNEGIARTLKFLDRCRFHKTNCAWLLECLEDYHEKKNKQMSTEDKPVFTGKPEETQSARHMADMVRYASMAVKRISSGGMTADESRELWRKHIRR